MTAGSDNRPAAPATDKHLDDTCGRFESAWVSGKQPRIEDFLSDSQGVTRSSLVRELIRIEIAQLVRRGEQPKADSYRLRFPEVSDEIDTVFTESKASAAKPPRDVAITEDASQPTDAAATMQLSDGPMALDALSETVASYQSAWDANDEPPHLAELLPADPPALRRMLLFELVKVDLARRWRPENKTAFGKRLDYYTTEFGQIIGSDDLPFDVVYEEFRVLQDAGEAVTLEDYIQRYPKHANSLRRCSGEAAIATMTGLAAGKAAVSVDLDETIDDFELVRKLGAGAFATVYLARQRSMDRLVALKISAHGTGNEPRTLAQLDHPNIVRVFDQRWLPDRRLRLLYMEYAPGGTLMGVIEHMQRTPDNNRCGDTLLEAIDQTLDARGAAPRGGLARERLRVMTWEQVVCHVGAQLASALSYADEKSVLHRDIKPANILMAADGTPKLADFNIAYGSQLDGATPAAYFGGSLAYMSPEQLEACNPSHPRTPGELDGRSDIYALGTVIWELLTGRRPLADLEVDLDWLTTLNHFTEQRRKGIAARELPHVDMVSPGVRDVVAKCLAPDPKDRYENADQLRRQLRLQQMPEVQALLCPADRSWCQRVIRHPLIALTIAMLIPNIILAALNLFYNIREIIYSLPESGQAAFHEALTGVNVVAWGVCTAICIYYLWPIFSAVAKVRRAIPLTWDEWLRVGPRTLHVPSFAAAIAFAGWTLTGIAFPVVIDIKTGGAIAGHVYAHFIVSQIIHGVIGAALCFFFVALPCVRAIYPRFIPETILEDGAEAGLLQTKRLVTWYSGALGAAPMLAIFALATTGAKQDYFVLLAMLGAAGFVVSLGIKPLIQGDLERLRPAVRAETE